MKKFAAFALIFVLALSLYACRMGETQTTEGTTVPAATEPTVTTPIATNPIATDPIITDPTIEPNVPDPSVDNNHLIDPTEPVETEGNMRRFF